MGLSRGVQVPTRAIAVTAGVSERRARRAKTQLRSATKRVTVAQALATMSTASSTARDGWASSACRTSSAPLVSPSVRT